MFWKIVILIEKPPCLQVEEQNMTLKRFIQMSKGYPGSTERFGGPDAGLDDTQ